MARGNVAERLLPFIAVGLGLGHAAFLGGLATPVTFTRTVLAVGVLCPLMMGESATKIGRTVLRPQARLLPLLISVALGPVLALAIGRFLLRNHPEQARALLLLSLLPGSALAPIWANGTRASRTTTIALTLTTWSIATFVSLPLFARSFASIASFIAFRDLVFLGAMPLALGGACRFLLSEVLEPEEYARDVEPMRQTVLQASLAVLLFTTTASDRVAAVLRSGIAIVPVFVAVTLLYLGLFAGCGAVLLVLRRARATARGTLLATTTRQTALAMSVLPLVVAPSALSKALAVPLLGLILELVLGTAALAWFGSWATARRATSANGRDGRASVVPE